MFSKIKRLFIKDIIELKPVERWKYLKEIFIKEKKRKVIHFLHVPKTAGTTLGVSLQSDKKANVVSVDAPVKEFLNHVKIVKKERDKEKVILTRAHHPFHILRKADVLDSFSSIFSAYRDPIAIHISNVNMIMSRLEKFNNKVSIKEPELSFCKKWDHILKSKNIVFQNTKEVALQIINSNEYIKEMGNLYYKFFGDCTEEELKLISFIDYRNFDDVYTKIFFYNDVPNRLNVGTNKIISYSDLNNNIIEKLIEKDKFIIDYIQNNLVSVDILADKIRRVN